MEIHARTPQQIGDALKRFRKLRNLTQRQITEQVGLRQATISSVESGDGGTQLKTLTEILKSMDLELVIRDRAKGDGVPLEDLF
jgi:HTH-type transcriptional regulator/antitoxin HipB